MGTVGRARDHGLDPATIARSAGPGLGRVERSRLRLSDELFRDFVVSDETWRSLSRRIDTGLTRSAVFTTSGYRAIFVSLNAYGVQPDEGDEWFPQGPRR